MRVAVTNRLKIKESLILCHHCIIYWTSLSNIEQVVYLCVAYSHVHMLLSTVIDHSGQWSVTIHRSPFHRYCTHM